MNGLQAAFRPFVIGSVSLPGASERPAGEVARADSAQARRQAEVGGLFGAQQTPPAEEQSDTTRERDEAASKEGSASARSADSRVTLSEEALAQVEALKARDREVRAHEQAHAAVGGPYAGGPSYVYQKGPDGQRYAVAGEVSIDVAPIANDPEATIDKMQVVIAAALAPADPSPQDRQIAATAQSQLIEATAEAAQERTEALLGEEEATGRSESRGIAAFLSAAKPAQPPTLVDVLA